MIPAPVSSATQISSARVDHASRLVRAAELRRRGWSYAEIAREIGVSEQVAYGMIQRRLRDLARSLGESIEAVRAIEIERLDAMLRALDARLDAGDPQAVTAALRVAERRARLLGLDAPSSMSADIDASGDGTVQVEVVIRPARASLIDGH